MLDFVFRYVKCTEYVMQKLYAQKIYKHFARILVSSRWNNQLQFTEEDLFVQDMSGRWYVFYGQPFH